MRRWIPFVFLVGLAFLALRPLWWQPSPYFFLDDGYLHLFRVFEFDRVLREGVVYPRWAPDLAYGYGYPIFNYYPPLAYYLTETLHIFGLSIPAAIKAAFVVVVLVGASGAFMLGVELAEDDRHLHARGLLTAAAYVFFPYFLLDIYTRGAIAECVAAAVLPWLVRSLRRSLKQQTLAAMLTSAIFIAALVLSHNLTALFSAPLLAAFVIWEWLHLTADRRVKGAGLVGAAVLLGAALSAIYWLPLIAELPLVAVSRETKQLAIIVQYSFLSLRDVLQFSILYQYHEAPFPLAIVPMGLAAVALLLALIAGSRLRQRGTVIFFGLVVLMSTILLTDWTSGIWLGLPVLMTLQFPWRLSMLIGLGVAVIIGFLPAAIGGLRVRVFTSPPPFDSALQNAAPLRTNGPVETRALGVRGIWLSRPSWARKLGSVSGYVWLTITLIPVLVWVGLANLAPQRLDNPRDEITLGQLVRFEANSRNVGLGTMDEYLPLTVKYLPRQLENKIVAPVTPQITLEEYSSTRRAMTTSSSERFALSLHSFYFPDWQVTVDGQPATAGSSTAMGLLTVEVPAGDHRVVFQLGDTLARRAGVLLSALGAAILLGLVAWAAYRQKRRAVPAAATCAILAAVFAVPTSLAVASSAAPLQSVWEDLSPQQSLIGLRIEDARFQSGTWIADRSASTLNLQAYWHVKQQVADRPFTWQLVDDAGRVWAKREQRARYSFGLPGTWVPNQVIEDQYDLPLAPGMPAGRYMLQVAYEGKPVAVSAIEMPQGTAPAAPDPRIEHALEAQVGDRIRFLGYDSALVGAPEQTLPLTLYWRAEKDIPEDWTVFVQLLDGNRTLVAQKDGLTANGFFPTTLWAAGRIVSDRRDIQLPGNLVPGLYHLVAGLYRFDDMMRLPVTTLAGPSPDDQIELGTVKVLMPSGATPKRALTVSLGENIRLLGFDLSSRDSDSRVLTEADAAIPAHLNMRPGNGLALNLHWQALARPEMDYKVFVHIVDDQGNVVAQQDRMPGGDRYPTHIWDAGEKVVDSYLLPLQLPAGRYNIVVGMYAPQSGERLVAVGETGNAFVDRQIKVAQIEMAAE